MTGGNLTAEAERWLKLNGEGVDQKFSPATLYARIGSSPDIAARAAERRLC